MGLGDDLRDPAGGPAIAIGIMRPRHCGVSTIVIQQPRDLRNDLRAIGADKLCSASRHPLRPLRRLAHHQNRLAKRGCFFLHATTVGKHDIASIKQTHKAG